MLPSADFRLRRCDYRVRAHQDPRFPGDVRGARVRSGFGRGCASPGQRRHLSRKKIRHCHATLLGINLEEARLDALCRRFSALVEDEVVMCDWVPGAPEVLATHFGRRPMFVVSGTPQQELTRIIERRGLSRWFTEAHGSPPEKAITVRSILARHDLDPGAVLFIGDAAADWRAARQTGVRFIGRLADGQPSPFPAGTPLISDLRQLIV